MVGLRQFSLPPFDSQQPLAQHSIAVAGLRHPGTQLHPGYGQQHCAVLVQDIEIRLDHGSGGSGYPRIAVTRVASGTVGTQPMYAQRHEQTAGGRSLNVGMDCDGLEAGIQQRGLHDVGIVV